MNCWLQGVFIMSIYELNYNNVSVDINTDGLPRIVCLIVVSNEIMFVLEAGDIITAKEMMSKICPELHEFEVIFRPIFR